MRQGDGLCIRGAEEAVLLVACATSYNGFEKHPNTQGTDCRRQVEQWLARGDALGYAALKECHLADYCALYGRVALRLDGEEYSALPTDERIDRVKRGGTDNGLLALLFQYGRYLLIASSRPGSQPANLQGIWNKDLPPIGAAAGRPTSMWR